MFIRGLRTTLVLAVLAIPSRPLAGQDSAAAAAPLAPYLMAISVSNLDSTVSWYRTLLGFRVMRAPYAPVPGLRIAFLIRDDFRLELLEAAGSGPRRLALPDTTRDISLQGFTKLAFQVTGIDSLASRLRQRGVRFVFGPATDTAFRIRHFIVADPDGNLIQLVQPAGS
jgi:methylmalonyl-CoA/ethylmalonyl-CoA epimerase